MPAATVDRSAFDRLAAAADLSQAARWVEQTLEAGAAPMDVLEVIADVQRMVGERWATGDWSVAQEHAATLVSTRAVDTVVRLADNPATRGHVVLACADREWHELPAALVAAALQLSGWRVTMLGASSSPALFSRAVQDQGPDLTAVSCSILGSLPSARSLIESSTAAGVPVLVGGAAFGTDGSRAQRLGATLWAADARHAVEVAAQAPAVASTTPPLDAEAVQEVAVLELTKAALLRSVHEGWQPRGRPRGDDPTGLPPLFAEVLQQVFSGLVASLLTGEPGPLHQTLGWGAALFESRGVSRNELGILHNVLVGELREYPLAEAMVVRHWTG